MRSLLAYDAEGNVVATCGHMVIKDEDGKVIGLVDFAAHEEAGGRLRDIWENDQAVGSGTWPEWLGGAAHHFTVELDPSPGQARAKIAALVHKKSGHRRERAVIEAEIERRHEEKRAAARERGEAQRQELKRRAVPAEVVAEFGDPPPEPVDLRDLLGGPGKPLLLDESGRNRQRDVSAPRPALPVVRRAPDHPR